MAHPAQLQKKLDSILSLYTHTERGTPAKGKRATLNSVTPSCIPLSGLKKKQKKKLCRTTWLLRGYDPAP